MPPPPRPFRLVYRAFGRIEFDPAKSDEVFELRGLDLAYVGRIFPGYVLGREDTRDHPEPRHQAIGELLGGVLRGLCSPWRYLPPHRGLDRGAARAGAPA